MKRPFWIHQIAEYLLGIALISQGLQSSSALVPTLLGLAIVVNAAIVSGPLSAAKVVRRRTHRTIDVVLVALCVVAVVVARDDMTSSTVVMVLGVAVVIAFLVVRSDFTEKVRRPRVDASGGRAEEIGRLAGRAAGDGVKLWRRVRGTS
jgi:Ca2+/Na+ antiporter